MNHKRRNTSRRVHTKIGSYVKVPSSGVPSSKKYRLVWFDLLPVGPAFGPPAGSSRAQGRTGLDEDKRTACTRGAKWERRMAPEDATDDYHASPVRVSIISERGPAAGLPVWGRDVAGSNPAAPTIGG